GAAVGDKTVLKDTQDTPLPDRINSKLSWEDCANVLRLDASGKSSAEIAAFYGVNRSTITRLLAAFGNDTREIAKRKLSASAVHLADQAILASEKAAARGDGSVALELLDRTETLQKRDKVTDTGPKVVLVVGHQNPPDSALPPMCRPQLVSTETQPEACV